MKMVEHGLEPALRSLEPANVPWRERKLFALEDVDLSFEHLRPEIQIFLVAELSIFRPCKTPLDAPVLPPLANTTGALVVPECYKLDAESPALRSLVILRIVRVLCNKDVFPAL